MLQENKHQRKYDIHRIELQQPFFVFEIIYLKDYIDLLLTSKGWDEITESHARYMVTL